MSRFGKLDRFGTNLADLPSLTVSQNMCLHIIGRIIDMTLSRPYSPLKNLYDE